MEKDCIFCKIANGEIPASTVYEDDMFRVILDMSPATKGHALILPKKHMADIFEMDSETAEKAFVLVAKVAKGMKAALNCDGLNIVQNNGEVAGQTVFHFHMHIIPRYEGDGQNINWVPGTSEAEERERVAQQIRSGLN
ncbi:HIT family protein [Frisingicoccus sp.]|uniref:HIT family protein n=1 Tax=Frisingicoccus sp. TaxID=1918627 RepID=UPI003AB4C4FD